MVERAKSLLAILVHHNLLVSLEMEKCSNLPRLKGTSQVDSKEPLKSSLHRILACHDSFHQDNVQTKKVSKKVPEASSFQVPAAFFDGAEQNNSCGCGVHIVMDDSLQYFLSWHGGHGSNTMAEARALTGLLAFCDFFDIQGISIYGDSKSLIDHVNGNGLISSPHLLGWLSRIMHFRNTMKQISFQHIPRSRNVQADLLSKEGLAMKPGLWSLRILHDGSSFLIQDFSIKGM